MRSGCQHCHDCRNSRGWPAARDGKPRTRSDDDTGSPPGVLVVISDAHRAAVGLAAVDWKAEAERAYAEWRSTAVRRGLHLLGRDQGGCCGGGGCGGCGGRGEDVDGLSGRGVHCPLVDCCGTRLSWLIAGNCGSGPTIRELT